MAFVLVARAAQSIGYLIDQHAWIAPSVNLAHHADCVSLIRGRKVALADAREAPDRVCEVDEPGTWADSLVPVDQPDRALVTEHGVVMSEVAVTNHFRALGKLRAGGLRRET